jgi:hypothetical protein
VASTIGVDLRGAEDADENPGDDEPEGEQKTPNVMGRVTSVRRRALAATIPGTGPAGERRRVSECVRREPDG